MSLGFLAKLVPSGVKRKIIQDALGHADTPEEVDALIAPAKFPTWLSMLVTWVISGGVTGLSVYFTTDNACLDISLTCVRPVITAFIVGGLTSVVNHLRDSPQKASPVVEVKKADTVVVEQKKES